MFRKKGMAFGFTLPLGLIALASIIPLIILYLIKPKPTNLPIPSLMFFIRNSKISKKNKILRHFQNDLLFYIQLLTLLFLALAIGQPYLTQARTLSSENQIFVLDVSASSQVNEGATTRLDLAKEKIQDFANINKNTLILAKNAPLVALRDVSRSELLGYLKTLHASDEETNLGSAILLAGELIPDKGRVIVLSDFIATKGIPPGRAKTTLEGKSIPVDFVNTVLAPRTNIGIINLIVSDTITTIYVKNYADTLQHVPLLINNALATTLSIKPDNTETYNFPTPNGVSEIRIDIHDDLPADNIAYISTPEDQTIRVLYITNTPSKFLHSALTSNEHVTLTVAQPPIIPKEDYAIYVIHNIAPINILAGTFEELTTRAREHGSSVIIHAQEENAGIDYKTLTPFTITNKTTGGTITIDQNNRITRDIDFGILKNMYHGTLAKDSIVLASVNTTPVVTLSQDGNTNFVYYGLTERDSDFKISPDYPVFWTNLLKFLDGQQDLKDINLKTGIALIDDKNNQLILDKNGVYNLPTGKIAVNLLNEKESNINPQEQPTTSITHYTLEPVKTPDTYPLQFPILFLILGLFLFETIYMKIRGEI